LKSAKGETALHSCSLPDIARLLIDAGMFCLILHRFFPQKNPFLGAAINAVDNKQQTPLYVAVTRRSLGMMKILLEQPKIDVNIKIHSGESALHCCSWKGWIEGAELLIQGGAKVNARATGFVSKGLFCLTGHWWNSKFTNFLWRLFFFRSNSALLCILL